MESQERIFMIGSSVDRTRGNRAINAALDENYGEILKSGDNTLLRYKIFDGDGESLQLEGLPCEAVIKKDDIVVYKTPAEVDAENIVSFKITEVLPSDRNDPYTIEFIITQDQDTLIFPSDDRINLYIYPSSLSVDGEIIKQTPEDRLNEIVIVAVNDATQDFYSEVDEFRDTYNELIDTGVMQENINQKLAASEAEYAPRLTELEQNDADLTAQLAETMTQTEFDSWVSTLLDGGPSIFFDTLTALKTAYPQGVAGVALVRETDPAKIYVWNGTAWEDFGDYQGLEVKDASITDPKLAPKAVTYSKQDVISIGEGENLFGGTFSDYWFDTATLKLTKTTGVLSAIVKLTPQTLYEIRTIGVHNAFRVGFFDALVDGDEVKLYKDEVNVSRERKAFIRNAENYNYMILCLDSTVYAGSGTPQLSVKEMNTAYSYTRQMTENAAAFFVREWIDYTTDEWAGTSALRSVVYPIMENSHVQITTKGEHNRFFVYTSEDSARLGATKPLTRHFVKETTTGDEQFEFDNVSDKYVIIGISTTGLKPEVTITQTYTTTPETNDNEELLALKTNSLSLRNYRGTAITLIGSDYYVTTNASQSFATLIKPLTHYKIKVVGDNTDFLVATLQDEITNSLLQQGNYKLTSLRNKDKTIKEFEFVSGPSDVDLLVFLGGSAVTAQVTVEEVVTQLKYPVEKLATGSGITMTRELYPVMCGVKMSNENDVLNGNPQMPRPIGWLYYDQVSSDILYANGTPDNIKFLCKWKKDVTWNKTSSPSQYRSFITKKGDIVFVWRGDLLGGEVGIPNVRQNPIVYPANNWENPVEVNLGSRVKPSTWLQNSGIDYIYNKDILLFSEYTRPGHVSSYVWKVTEPITNPDNWRIVKDFPLSGDNLTGMKHCHTINYDPFSGKTFLTTGDDNSSAKVFITHDFGETWVEVLGGQNKYSRVLNFVFTKDKVFWGTDQAFPHLFLSADRDANGVPDFSTLKELYTFDYTTTSKATYVNAYIEEYNGILMLDRYDVATNEKLRVHFWDIDTQTMHVIKEIGHVEAAAALFGFRVTAANFYPTKGENKIVVGFDNPINNMDLLGNHKEKNNVNRLNNLVLEVVKIAGKYELKVTAINKRY